MSKTGKIKQEVQNIVRPVLLFYFIADLIAERSSSYSSYAGMSG